MTEIASVPAGLIPGDWDAGEGLVGAVESPSGEKAMRVLEEKALNAWPGLQQVVCDGWLMRFAGGYTRRANAVIPLYEGKLELGRKIRLCEGQYARRGLPTVFKMLPFTRPIGLDRVLQVRGYRREAETSVQVCDIGLLDLPVAAQVRVWSTLEPEWMAAQAGCSGMGEEEQRRFRAILENIAPQRCFAAVLENGHPVSCGVGVCEDGYLGLFCVVTQAQQRNRGYGRQLIAQLARWGRKSGAEQAYLQVVVGNQPARHLYARLGFREVYRYWYRVEGGEGK